MEKQNDTYLSSYERNQRRNKYKSEYNTAPKEMHSVSDWLEVDWWLDIHFRLSYYCPF